ncbi:MAG: hypothetical protein M3O70_17120, partial [Actinomycetota bacterium]|nr:hypothetical protein [Actinomycetota bacterium]
LQAPRRALHLAEVIAMAKECGPVGPPVGQRAEEGAVFEDVAPRFTRRDWLAAGAAAGAAAILAGVRWKRRNGA